MRTKVLYVSTYGDVRGGGEISLLTLLRFIDRDRYEPVLALPERGELAELAGELGIRSCYFEAPSLRHPAAALRAARTITGLSRIIGENGIGLLHANATARSAIPAGVAAALRKTPSILHARIIDSEGVLDFALFSLFDKIVTNSGAVAAKYRRYDRAGKKVVVVHNPVDIRQFQPGERSEAVRSGLGAGDGDILVGVVGRLVDFKGHRWFIDAAHGMAAGREAAGIKFAIIGDGPLRKELETRASAGAAAGKIAFTGARDDVPEIMNALDIFVLPSDEEHFGRVIIEAMACGKPVVATRAGGVPEIVTDGETGYLTAPRDPRALATAIGRLAGDAGLRKRMGDAGRARAVESFSAEKHAAGIQAVYEELLSARNH